MRFQKIRAALLALVICTGVLSTTVFAYVDESRVEHLKNCTLSKPERIKAMIDQKVGKITKKEIMDAHPDISKTTVERTLADFHKLFIYLISYTDEVDIFTMTEIIKQKIVSGCKNPFRTFYIAVMHYGVWLLIFCERSRCKCTSLQREANRALGYTGQQTLDYTQNLYEKKLVTYPRTDSRFLTEDMAHSLPDLVKLAFHAFPVEDVDNVPIHAEQVVNNKKVTDHHAIILTRELQKCNLSELPKGELAILQLISHRLWEVLF